MTFGEEHQGQGIEPARNRSVTHYFMEHTLAVADAMVALELCCLKQRVRLINLDHHDTVKWRITVHQGGSWATLGVVPDRTFGLAGEDRTRWFFLEADRATMPVERNNLKQTSFYRKLLAYYETWRQGLLKDRFPRFRVLTVTTTPERAKGLLESSRRLTQGKGSGLFLFTNQRVFNTREDVLQLRLLNGRGEEVLLLDWPRHGPKGTVWRPLLPAGRTSPLIGELLKCHHATHFNQFRSR